ncbi:MAG: amidohydrolase family protein [Methanoregulaceae archaeon]|jgi:5-methylthioadenosine/S-adenosylhomocysteine deaminase|nr:amidohydrolase family protein [Methanoregulaceae archaeon]
MMAGHPVDFPEKPGSLLIKGALTESGPIDICVDEDGFIGAAGPDAGRNFRGEAEYVLDGTGSVALPGLVNTHTHAAMTLLRGYADDMPLQPWLSEKIWPLESHLNGDDVYWGTRLACLEMIRTGTTAFKDMYFFMEDAARAVEAAGLRAVLSYGFIDLGNEQKREQEIRGTERFVRHIKALDNPRIKASVGPHAIYTVSQEGLFWLAEYSKEEGIAIHIHLSETEQEVRDSVKACGMRPPEVLDRCGILTPRTVAAHCCWLDQAECSLLGKRGVSVAYNPVSNMKLAVNRAMPYHWLKEAGVNVSLGTDGCSSNNNLDMFEEMKTGALLQKFYWNSPTLLPASEMLSLATTGGARALRLGSGTITPGNPADLILLDRHAVCNTPLHNITSNVVYSCNGSAVMTVLCQGRVLMMDRYIPGEEEVLQRASAVAEDLVKRAGMR